MSNTVLIPFQQLSLLNRFLFDEVMKDDQACQAMFELILNRKLGPFSHTESEKEFRKSPVFRSIRVDVYSSSDEAVFNAEMQGKNTGSLPKRSRLYQAHLDTSLLAPGMANFNLLNDSYIVLICPFDLFGEGRYMYTFQMRSKENPSLLLEDGATRIFLNTRGRNDDEVPTDLVEFLHYIENSDSPDPPQTTNPQILCIHNRVMAVRKNEEVEARYMQAWEEELLIREESRQEGLEAGRQEGLEAGRQEGLEAGRQSFIRNLLKENFPDEKIIELSGCTQAMIDKERLRIAQSAPDNKSADSLYP